MRRFQARRGNGRFTGNTMGNTFGLHCAVCPYPDCRRLNPSKVGEPRPETCHACGRSLVDGKAQDMAREERLRDEGIIGGRYDDDEMPMPVGAEDGSLHAVGCRCGGCSTARIADEWDPRMGPK